MGSRVHYVVIRGGVATKARRGGGFGLTLDVQIAAGPEKLIDWVDEIAAGDRYVLSPSSELSDWLGDTLCEGAVLLDVDSRYLLFFTDQPWSEDPRHDYERRAGLLDALPRTWPGWRIDWAYDGLADIVGYLGEDVEGLHDAGPAPEYLYRPEDEERDPVLTLVTVDTVGYGLSWTAEPAVEYGIRLIDLLAGEQPLTALTHTPQTGLHLDTASRHAVLWTIRPLCGLAQRWSLLWPGWSLEFCQDRYQQYPVAVPVPDIARGRLELANRFIDLWPSDRAYTSYTNTVNAASQSSSHLPEGERRYVRLRSRQAAQAAMEAATAEWEAIAVGVARSFL